MPIVGMPGPTGPPGATGATGPQVVPINNTIFVDEQFGTAFGVIEDLTKPFQTLTQGLVAAAAQNPSAVDQWTIYVQPGSYVSDTLNLIDGVNFFFTEGAIVSNATGPLFVANTGASDVTGYGQFNVSDTLLLITGLATINFEANSVISNTPDNTTALFNITTADPDESILVVRIDRVEHVQTTPVLLFDGNVKATITMDDVVAAGVFIRITEDADGSAYVQTHSIEGGDPGQTGLGNPLGAVILNQSDNFILQIITQLFRSHSLTQAIQATTSVVPIGPEQQNSTFLKMQECFVDGGVTYGFGAQPLDPFNQVFAPKISIHTQFIQALTLTDVVLFHCESFAITTIFADIIFERYQLIGMPVEPMFRSIDGILFVECDILASLTNSTFDIASTPNAAGSLNAYCIQIFCAQQLLNVSGNSSGVIVSDIVIAFGGSTSPIVVNTNASVTLVINQLQLNSSGGSLGAEVAVIDLILGSLSMRCFSYNYGGDFTYGIRRHAAANQLTMDINRISGGGNSTVVLYCTDGNTSIEAETISSSGTAILLDGNAFLLCNIVEIGVQGSGVIIDDNAIIVGYIGNWNTQNGPALDSNSNNDINLLFNIIQTSNAAQCINLTGNGACRLTGNVINTQGCTTGIVVGNNTQNTVLILKVNDLIFGNGGNIDSAIVVDPTGGGGALIDWMRLNINGNTNNPGILIRQGNSNFRGTTSSAPNNFILVGQLDDNNAARFRGYFGEVTTNNGAVLIIQSNNEVWYHADSSQTNSNAAIIDITAPTPNPAYTVGGYMRTNGPNAIVINGPNAPSNVRVLSSDIVNDINGNSIVSVGFGVGPFPRVVIVPSIANTAALDIDQIPSPLLSPPFGTLFVDPNVQ